MTRESLVNIADDRPSEGFDHCVVLSVTIRSSPDRLYNFLTDIEGLSEFFPQVEFKLGTEGPLAVGSIYHTRQHARPGSLAARPAEPRLVVPGPQYRCQGPNRPPKDGAVFELVVGR